MNGKSGARQACRRQPRLSPSPRARDFRRCGHWRQALREVEVGNERLGKLMSRFVDEGAEFESLMNSAREFISTLGEGAAALPAVAARLETANSAAQPPKPQAQDAAVLDDLFAVYTMEREREVHWTI